MNAAALLDELRATGVTLKAAGDRLKVRAAPGLITPELTARLKSFKPELMAILGGTKVPASDGELSQDLPLLAALAEFDALIERLCDLRNHPADVREQMRQVLRRMAPYNVPGELDAVRELVKQAEAGDLSMLSDDRITCRNCWKRAPNGICGIAKPGGIVNAKVGYIPDALLPHRCPGFIPKTVGGDQRTGAERWPGLDD